MCSNKTANIVSGVLVFYAIKCSREKTVKIKEYYPFYIEKLTYVEANKLVILLTRTGRLHPQ